MFTVNKVNILSRNKKKEILDRISGRAIDEARTRDLHLGKVAYYQLYYYRIYFCALLFPQRRNKYTITV